MNPQDLALMGHLMRRAGFGATRKELGRYCATGYEKVVDELLDSAEPQMMSVNWTRRKS